MAQSGLAYLNGVQVVAGSNPAVPTRKIHKSGQQEKSLPAFFYVSFSELSFFWLLISVFIPDAFREGLKEVVCSAAVLCVRHMIGELSSNGWIGLYAVFLSHRRMQNDC